MATRRTPEVFTLISDAIRKGSIRNSFAEEYLEDFAEAVPFEITDVFEWLSAEHTGDPLRILLSQLGPCTPPYPVTFFEYSEAVRYDQGVERTGVLLRTVRNTGGNPNWHFHGNPLFNVDDYPDNEIHAPQMVIPENGPRPL